MEILHITNGSNSVDLMEAANIEGDKISWDDLLHEGPAPSGLSLEALSKIRAEYIVGQGWGNKPEVLAKFDRRNYVLKQCKNYLQIVLWFEHDLYDQLQLIQILDWFNQQTSLPPRLELICIDQYLGYHTPAEFAQLTKHQVEVTATQLSLASNAWNAFTANNPNPLNSLIQQDLSDLPYLKNALIRLMNEYPDEQSGLPLTERLILESLRDGELPPGKVFQQYLSREEAQFMGDLPFWARLNRMAFCEFPIIEFKVNEPVSFPLNPAQKIYISDYGRQTLSAKANWFADNKLSKFVGGCEISKSNYWCWSEAYSLIRKITTEY